MPPEYKERNMVRKVAVSLDALPTLISSVFDQVQASVANHRKNCVALYNIQSQAASITENVRNTKAPLELVGERAFSTIFIDMLSRMLGIKKGSTNVDRVVKFIGSYVKFVSEKSE